MRAFDHFSCQNAFNVTLCEIHGHEGYTKCEKRTAKSFKSLLCLQRSQHVEEFA